MKSIIVLSFVCLFLRYSYAQDGPVKEYFSNGKIKSEVNLVNGVYEGEAKFYYENGNLKEERFYMNGRVEGLVRYYNQAGKLTEMATLENGKRQGATTFYDSTGAYLTDVYYENGKKVVEDHPYYEKKKPIKKTVDSLLTKEVKTVKQVKQKEDEMLPPEVEQPIDYADSTYRLTAEIIPEPVGGPNQIQRKVHYPKEAREAAIQGTVIILTYIDEYGVVKLAEVVEGIGYGCDESAKIAVYYTKFKPALQRGKPVRFQMTIPVEFKLNP